MKNNLINLVNNLDFFNDKNSENNIEYANLLIEYKNNIDKLTLDEEIKK